MSVENVSNRSKSPNLLGTDLSDSSVLRELNKKRGTIKSRLTLFVKFVTSYEGAQLTERQLSEFKLRSDVAKTLLSEFNKIQSSIEELVSENDISQQLEVREAFENTYYQTQTTVVSLLAQSSTPNRPSSQSNIHSLVKLPTISLPSFDGSYDGWLEFRDTFLSMIHNSNQLDDMQKFHYLRSSL